MTAPPWETVSFDCYGTLVDWETGIRDAFLRAAAADGVELDDGSIIAAYHEIEPQVQSEEYRPYREVLAATALGVARRLGWPLEPERAGFLAESLPDWPVFPDTRPALERLKSRFAIAILSNVDDDLLRGSISRIGVDFDWTITAERVRSYKPAPAHLRAALARAGGAARLLHAAQSYFHDIGPAVELGIPAVWVNRKAEGAPQQGGPLHTVADLTELVDWLEKLD
ncbi:MAG: HAD family hydrolase [Gemmatimonadetes bacterium]|uniref:HAD family hydrolase n=1 Tax=Candidatus Kutchimonas denitrificans TaxID=3056748 RepID=A0AAE4Z5V8_9BACT|nr:HAD family hydrolase [Gemmatimonadota bacterium]NIR74334.1 HAD family hydrolase [Candidatus Kutchimonas denitrificans]NIS02585.1 HAD family hydrolase [Gemmatimonadota bacterium]NIT68460.1 HAD family hydrolase [Gemmatimonadota bacterium]NIU51937.1 HAD family hydrolase [Gemmatimonadota bacterium]